MIEIFIEAEKTGHLFSGVSEFASENAKSLP
jgi:hypothetical protein